MVRFLYRASGMCLLLAVAMVALGADDGPGGDGAAVVRMDALWSRRDRNEAVQELVAVGSGAAGEAPSYEVEWRLARAYFWVAYTQSNRVVKKAMAGKAMEWAERARAQRPDRVEGHYLYAIAVGQYADTIGIMQAVMDGIVGKVQSAAERAYAIDRDYYHGAPGTVLGRFYYVLPWPKRDLEQSRHYLEEVVARHPSALTARCYLADTYYDLGRHDETREQLRYVLTHEVAPGTELDLPSPKALGQEATQRWFPSTGSGG